MIPFDGGTAEPGTLVDLLRHGEVERGSCLGAAADAVLTVDGFRQVQSWARAAWRWDGITSSPLKRCLDTARTLCAPLGLTPQVEPRFREIGFGDWEGRSWTDLLDRHGEALQAFWARPQESPAPGGEGYADFECRVFAAFEDLIRQARGRHWLIVSHAGPIRAILRKILDLPLERLFGIEVPYASLARVRVDEIGKLILLWQRGPP